MTMVVEHQTRPYGGGMGYESVYHHGHTQSSQSHYHDSWPPHSSASHPPPSMYASAAVPSNTVNLKREDVVRPPPISLPYTTSSVPVSAPSSLVSAGQHYGAAAYSGPEMMVLPPELPRTTFEQAQPITSTVASFPPVNYAPMDYSQSIQHHQQPTHHPHVPPPHSAHSQQSQHSPVHPDPRSLAPGHEQPSPQATQQQSATAAPASAPSYGDALDASRGMVALSQDLAPRNIYGQPGVRAIPREAYAFPTAHSSASSISSGTTYPYYSASVSADSSVTDYSSTSESYDALHSRTLPRLSGLIGTMPPGPQSMMGQFSSKMPSNAQKKHKCKICDKRFTRPSSLQTHMYSHTGEKPYACDVEGCGRHFSVVSNLRRHKKVHKGEKDTGSPDEED